MSDRFLIDDPRIDSHCHLWTLARGDYHWMDETNPALSEIARDFNIDDLSVVRQTAQIDGSVLVQAAATEAETDFLLSIAEANPEILGVVGWVDLESSKAVQRLESFAQRHLFKGIRPMLQDIDDTDWLINGPPAQIWQSIADLGLRFDALIKPRHLPMIRQFCLDHPNLPIVIDHAAKPEFAADDPKLIKEWDQGLAAIGKDTHVYCKLSGLLTEMAPDQLGKAYDLLKPVLHMLLEAFGAKRIMWGSDWPVVRLAGGYEAWNELTMALLDDLSSSEQTAILSTNATEFYGLEL